MGNGGGPNHVSYQSLELARTRPRVRRLRAERQCEEPLNVLMGMGQRLLVGTEIATIFVLGAAIIFTSFSPVAHATEDACKLASSACTTGHSLLGALPPNPWLHPSN
jgi:hypothetical protein